MAVDKMTVYLEEVLSRVRWKQAHASIHKELMHHIQDAQNGFIEAGMPEEEAKSRAVREMGDAAEVGAKLDAANRPRMHWATLGLFGGLLLAGILLRRYLGGDSFSLATALLSLGLLAGLFFIPVRQLARHAWLCYALLCMLLGGMILAADKFGVIPIIHGQMYQLAYPALFLPIVYALLLHRMRGRGSLAVILLLCCLLPPALMLIWTANMIVLCMLIAACLLLTLYAALSGWFGGSRLLQAAISMLPFTVLLLLVLASPYRLARVQAILTPEIDPLGAGYIGTAIKQLMAGSRWWGAADITQLSDGALRLLQRDASYLYLQHDFMLTLLSVKLGKAAFAAAVLLLGAFLAGSLRVCLWQRSMLGRLLSLSVILTVAAQCAGYVLGNLGIVVFLKYPLPLLGVGNASLLCNLLLCGLMFSAFRVEALLEDGAAAPPPKRLHLQITWE